LLNLTALDLMGIDDLLALADTQDDPVLGMVLALLFAARNDGGLCIDLKAGYAPVQWPAPLAEAIGHALQRFLDRLRRGQYQTLIVEPNDSRTAPLVWVANGQRCLLYFQKYEWHERRLMAGLQALIQQSPAAPVTPQQTAAIITDLYSKKRVLRFSAERVPIAPDPDQATAISLALQHQFCVVSGGPGTGKTAVMVNILRALTRAGVDPQAMALAAPTGRAAQRMTETLTALLHNVRKPWPQDHSLETLQAATLHKLLGYRSGRHDFLHHAGYPLPYKAVIIDEASMVDVVMMAHLVDAIDHKTTRLILIGDKDQLPSVEAGAVFAQIMPQQHTRTPLGARQVTLQRSYRVGRRLRILAERVNSGELPAQEAVTFTDAIAPSKDCWHWVKPAPRQQWPALLEQWGERHYMHDKIGAAIYTDLVTEAAGISPSQIITDTHGCNLLDRIFTRFQAAKILTVLRRGPYGSEWINAHLAHSLAGKIDQSSAGGKIFNGMPVVCSRNDYRRGLFNGEMGVVLAHEDSDYAYFKRDGGYRSFPAAQMPFWEPALAITIHKSQGSEFGQILLVLPEEPHHRLLTREILYTGITRARYQVTLYGSHQSLQTALRTRLNRNPGRMHRLF
jgi:exodeoxyribonuclease V alpha subunit